jgi:hypothetical protein
MMPRSGKPAARFGTAMHVELGSARKQPLVLKSPLLAASGAAGAGALLDDLCTSRELGALVLPALPHPSDASATRPGIVPTRGGCLMAPRELGRQSWPTTIRRCRERGDMPLLAAIAPSTLDDCEALCNVAFDLGLHSVELQITPGMPPHLVADMTALLASAPLQACLVRLPLEGLLRLGEAATEGGADALVVAAPLQGRARRPTGGAVSGMLHAPALSPVYARAVQEASGIGPPVIGRGGIADWKDVHTMLASGAVAVEMDSILWAEPAALERLYTQLAAAVLESDATHWEGYLATIRSSGDPCATDPCPG